MFASSEIVKSFRQKAFRKIPQERLIRLDPFKGKKDLKRLETWEDHFQAMRVPYAITGRNGVRVLWKERRT